MIEGVKPFSCSMRNKTYIIFDTETHDVIISRDMIFDEFSTSIFTPIPIETMEFALDTENDDDEIV